jgi:uncharacterized protein (DUF1330 family)
VDVKDEEGMRRYAAASPAIYKKFGGGYLVRSNKCEVPEGTTRSRHVLVEFPASAVACYRSPEYQANIKVRKPHAVADFVIVEGYDGPQPKSRHYPAQSSNLCRRWPLAKMCSQPRRY